MGQVRTLGFSEHGTEHCFYCKHFDEQSYAPQCRDCMCSDEDHCTDKPTNYEEYDDSAVEHPKHYCKGGVECIDAIKAAMSTEAFMGYCKGNVLKYVWRFENKGGIEDLKKAGVYLSWLISAKSELDHENKPREF